MRWIKVPSKKRIVFNVVVGLLAVVGIVFMLPSLCGIPTIENYVITMTSAYYAGIIKSNIQDVTFRNVATEWTWGLEDDYDKVNAIYKELVSMKSLNETNGILYDFDGDGKVVCDDYAVSVCSLLLSIDIPCYLVVTMDVPRNAGHAYNLVDTGQYGYLFVDVGGGRWGHLYMMDNTVIIKEDW